jgi:cytidylate kinase
MAIITISRGSYSRGKEVAEKVAERLGYECIGRDVLLEASREFNIPEIKLIRAIHDAPSILARLGYGKEKYVSYIQAALLKHCQKDSVVYHGLAGHFFFRGVSHVLKVRILADLSDRVRLEMEREGISEKEALHILNSDDEQRKKWSQYLYGIDTWDPSLYDLVIHIRKLSAEDAVDIICHTARLPHLQTTPESQGAMDDLVLAAEVKAVLVDIKPDIEVRSKRGIVHIKTEAQESQEVRLLQKMQEMTKDIPGIKEIKLHAAPVTPYGD